MKKSDIIALISSETGIPRRTVREVFDKTSDVITDAILEGEKVSITGLGTFSLTFRRARQSRNPVNGDPIQVPERMAVRFKVARVFRQRTRELDTGEFTETVSKAKAKTSRRVASKAKKLKRKS